jgi:hypothetical protein
MNRKPRVTDQQALAALFGCFRRHGHETFPLTRGPERPALILAIDRGWLWGYGDAVRVTQSGVDALAPYLEKVPHEA